MEVVYLKAPESRTITVRSNARCARKVHACDHCNREIHPGSEYIIEIILTIIDKDFCEKYNCPSRVFSTQKYHLDCKTPEEFDIVVDEENELKLARAA